MATNENLDTTAVAGNFWKFWNEDERKLFSGGLPKDATEAQIKERFGQFGEIERVTRLRGFCSIVYKSVESLEAAVATEHTISKTLNTPFQTVLISNKKVFVKKSPVYCHAPYLLGGLILLAAIAGTFLYKLLTLTPEEN